MRLLFSPITEDRKMSENRTLIILKPDIISRRLYKIILDRISSEGFVIANYKWIAPNRQLMEKFYEEHRGKPFYESQVEYMVSGPCLALMLKRYNAINHWRAIQGATDPAQAEPGTIRGDFGLVLPENCTHGSDSTESFKREKSILFG